MRGLLIAALLSASLYGEDPTPVTPAQQLSIRSEQFAAYAAALDWKRAELAEWEALAHLYDAKLKGPAKASVLAMLAAKADAPTSPAGSAGQVIDRELPLLDREGAKLSPAERALVGSLKAARAMANQMQAAMNAANAQLGQLVEQIKTANHCPACEMSADFKWVVK